MREKCQPKRFRCPSEHDEDASSVMDKFSSLLGVDTSSSKEELREIFEEADSLISAETRKVNRERLRGYSNVAEAKLAKKKLIANEEEAWVYARLYRLREKFSKSGEETSLIEGFLYGVAKSDSKTISEAKAFLDSRTAAKKEVKISPIAANKATEIEQLLYLTAEEKLEQQQQQSLPLPLSSLASLLKLKKLRKNNQILFDIANGKLPSEGSLRGLINDKEVLDMMRSYLPVSMRKEHPNLSLVELCAVAAWTGDL